MQKLLFALLVLSSVHAVAQENNPLFSISAPRGKANRWTMVQQFDLKKGPAFSPVYSGNDKELLAACAYDRQQDRLYFTPIEKNQLRYLDLGNPKTGIQTVYGPEILPGADMHLVGNQITRMTIDGKGNGYALNNDATHLIRFNTVGQWMVQDLGIIEDAATNDVNSVHNPCLSWGGDIAADISGNLVLVSGNRAVYFIDVQSKSATYKGMIKGLPNNYTTNGIAADENGHLIVGSATSAEGLFQVEMKTLEASRVAGSVNNAEHVSDLASAFLINEDKKKVARAEKKSPFIKNESVSIYPNPITDNRFRISFDGVKAGRYELQLFDWNGKMVSKQTILVYDKLQTEQVQARGAVAKGIYLVKLVGKNARVFYSDKLIVQ